MLGILRIILRMIPIGAFFFPVITHAKSYESILPPSSLSQLEKAKFIVSDEGASIFGSIYYIGLSDLYDSPSIFYI
jgi:hypothetical protein